MNQVRRPRRKLTLADRLAEIDTRIERHRIAIAELAERRLALVEAERAKAQAVLDSLPEAHATYSREV